MANSVSLVIAWSWDWSKLLSTWPTRREGVTRDGTHRDRDIGRDIPMRPETAKEAGGLDGDHG